MKRKFFIPSLNHAVAQFFIVRIPSLGVNGLALWPFILVQQPNPGPRLLNHERIHHRQQLELLLLPFYVWYGLEYAYHRWRGLGHYAAYMAIRFEREAYRHEGDLGYLKKRRVWGFLRE